MTAYTKFKEYIWLVNTIYKAKRITLTEINERWLETDMSEGIELARATFNRHKDAIEDILVSTSIVIARTAISITLVTSMYYVRTRFRIGCYLRLVLAM